MPNCKKKTPPKFCQLRSLNAKFQKKKKRHHCVAFRGILVDDVTIRLSTIRLTFLLDVSKSKSKSDGKTVVITLRIPQFFVCVWLFLKG